MTDRNTTVRPPPSQSTDDDRTLPAPHAKAYATGVTSTVGETASENSGGFRGRGQRAAARAEADRSISAPDDDKTAVAGTRAVADSAHHTGTGSNWSHPELWRASTDGPIGPGSVLKDRFVLDRLIGQGGMGSVYRALDRRKQEARDSQPYVALKLLNDDFRKHPDALVALQRETKKSQLLAHPNIVTVYDFDRDGTQVFMTMELLQGDPLDVVIRRRASLGGLPLNEALTIIDRMARGIAYAHKKGLVHSDFKPGNVFLTQEGEVKILDFGIARAARGIVNSDSGDQTHFDPASLGALTPAYASLQLMEGEAPEPSDDIYALACVAQELLTGRHPFLDVSGHKLSAAEVRDRGLRPAAMPKIPKRVRRCVCKGLALDRPERFADAGQFLDAIKPRVRMGRKVLAALVLLTLAASVSWFLVIRDSDMMVTLDGLPSSLDLSRDLIREGDRMFEAGDVPQAYARYALAWEDATLRDDLSAREQAQLRVIVDRRSNQVAEHFIREAERRELDEFSLELLRVTLEALARTDLGTRHERLRHALHELEGRLAPKP